MQDKVDSTKPDLWNLFISPQEVLPLLEVRQVTEVVGVVPHGKHTLIKQRYETSIYEKSAGGYDEISISASGPGTRNEH